MRAEHAFNGHFSFFTVCHHHERRIGGDGGNPPVAQALPGGDRYLFGHHLETVAAEGGYHRHHLFWRFSGDGRCNSVKRAKEGGESCVRGMSWGSAFFEVCAQPKGEGVAVR
jgi:hypothetical protein